MRIGIRGMGLIGGSFEKAFLQLLARLGEYRDAIRAEDAVTLRKILAEGRVAKERAN